MAGEIPVVKRGGSGHDKWVKTIHAVFQFDGEWFVARCLDLPVTTQGKTLTAAKRNLREAVALYFETWGKGATYKPAQEVYLTSLEVEA